MQTNLVSSGFVAAPTIDPTLINAWGIASNGTFLYVSAADSQAINVYNVNGTVARPPIPVLPGASGTPASPTGLVLNTSGGYLVNGSPATVLVATEAGTVNAFNSTTGSAVVKIDNSLTGIANYKGLAITPSLLYLADFSTSPLGGSIDVFNSAFLPAPQPVQTAPSPFAGQPAFVDPNIPLGFAPFNVAVINGLVYVLYARKNPADPSEDLPGPGNGFINIFTPTGNFVRRFASGGVLNSPWGITLAPNFSGLNPTDILVGNFGDGTINVFNFAGTFVSKLQDCSGSPIIIPGLWGLTTSPLNASSIYFAAGPLDETAGLVGVLTPCPNNPVFCCSFVCC